MDVKDAAQQQDNRQRGGAKCPTVLLVKSLMVSTLGNLGKAVARNSLRVSYIATSVCRQRGARGVWQPVAVQRLLRHYCCHG